MNSIAIKSTRPAIVACSAALALVTLSGCASQQALDDKAFLVGAMPLKGQDEYIPKGKDGNPITPVDNRAVIMNIANDSQTKCLAFLQELSIAETGSDTSLDIATTALSALSTAFSPAATKTALSAASTITGGMKTAIDADFYAKSAIANYAKAIQGTYFKDMKDFRALMGDADSAKLDIGVQYGAIGSIHSECTLGVAQSSISANLTPGGTTPPSGSSPTDQAQPPTTTNVSVAGTLSGGDTVSLAAHSSAFAQPLVATTRLPPGDSSLADATAGLVQFINASADFKSRQISAKPGAVPNTIDLTSPAALAVAWGSPQATPTGHAGRGHATSRPVGKVESITTAPVALAAKPSASKLYGVEPGQRY